MAAAEPTRSRIAGLAGTLATLGLVAMAIGVTVASLDLVPAFVGFRLFGLGLLFCLLAFLLGLAGLLATRRRPGRASAWRGVLGGLIGIGIVAVAAAPARMLPPINDITTDPADPPAFVKALEHEPNRGRDMAYPGEAFTTAQREGYPDLAPHFPFAGRMQRATADLVGLRAEGMADGRGWLNHGVWPESFHPLRKECTVPERFGPAQPYAFVPVQGDGVHEIPVGPVHAGIIEPGHFRFSIVGEKVLRLEARPPNAEGAGAVSVRELVRTALRMRPDRVVVGEVRGGEAFDMLQALNTGHDGSLSTVHANGAAEALARLEARVALEALVPELPHLERHNPETQLIQSLVVRGPSTLRLVPTRASAA